jgi:hypothetical protein
MLSRQAEYEQLRSVAASSDAAAAALADKLALLARINRAEKECVDIRLQEVIFGHGSEWAEQQYAFSLLQAQLDDGSAHIHALQTQVCTCCTFQFHVWGSGADAVIAAVVALGETHIDGLKARIAYLEQALMEGTCPNCRVSSRTV